MIAEYLVEDLLRHSQISLVLNDKQAFQEGDLWILYEQFLWGGEETNWIVFDSSVIADQASPEKKWLISEL